MDMVICPISPFSRPLVGRRNDLLAFAPEVFGHSLRRRSESYILFTIANLPSATFKKMGDSSSQGPPTIRSNPVVIVDLWLLNMGKLGPTIPVAALSTITKVIFRLSKDMVDQIREQPVKWETQLWPLDSGKPHDTSQFRALLLRKDTQLFGKVHSLLYGRLQRFQRFGGIVLQNQAPNAFPGRTQFVFILESGDSSWEFDAYCQQYPELTTFRA